MNTHVHVYSKFVVNEKSETVFIYKYKNQEENYRNKS